MNLDDLNTYPMTGWFPGHMLKAGREMREALKLVDLVVELTDARAPSLTRNPALRENLGDKPFLLVANKADLAEPAQCKKWEEFMSSQGIRSFFLDSQRLKNPRSLSELWRNIILEERARRGATRPLLRPVRIMIVGIPNIGKSTLVNRMHEKNKAQMGPKPGVTRHNQWIKLVNDVELLDTPGVLWPRIQNKCHELLLTLLGNIKDELTPPVMLAQFLLLQISRLGRRDCLTVLDLNEYPEDPDDLLLALAKRRNMLAGGGTPDLDRAAKTLIKEFRDGKLGRFTFERTEEPQVLK